MTTAIATPEVSEVVFSMPPDTQNPAPKPPDQEEFDVLVKAAREFGTKYGAPYFRAEAAFSKAFAENVDDFLRLREMFPQQGSHATRTVAGVEYTWKSFCQQFLHITPEYFGQLVRKLRPDPNRAKPEPRPVEDTPAYRAGYCKGREETEKEAVANVDEDPEELANPDASLTDVLAFFAQYKKDTAQFAEALRATVRHFGLTRKISVEEI